MLWLRNLNVSPLNEEQISQPHSERWKRACTSARQRTEHWHFVTWWSAGCFLRPQSHGGLCCSLLLKFMSEFVFLEGRDFARHLCVNCMNLHHDYAQCHMLFSSASNPVCLFQGHTPELVSNNNCLHMLFSRILAHYRTAKSCRILWVSPKAVFQSGVTSFGAGCPWPMWPFEGCRTVPSILSLGKGLGHEQLRYSSG